MVTPHRRPCTSRGRPLRSSNVYHEGGRHRYHEPRCERAAHRVVGPWCVDTAHVARTLVLLAVLVHYVSHWTRPVRAEGVAPVLRRVRLAILRVRTADLCSVSLL